MMWAFCQFCLHFGCLIHQKYQISWHYSFIQTTAIGLEMGRVQLLGSCAVKVKVGKSTACALFRGRVASESTVRARAGGFASGGWGRLPTTSLLIVCTHHHHHCTCLKMPKIRTWGQVWKMFEGKISDQGLSLQTLISSWDSWSLADCFVSFSPSY